MPNFKDASYFNQLPNDGNFDVIYLPGQPTPFSGIYKCTSCGFEAVSTRLHPLPPEVSCLNHSPSWRAAHGTVRWKLVAAAIHVTRNA
jgi:hypothetical protein